MGRATVETCGLCGTPMHGTLPNGSPQRLTRYNGLCVEVGYSVGGWGHRQDHIRRFSSEVCGDCYDRVMPAVEALTVAMFGEKKRRNPFVALARGGSGSEA